MEENKNQVIFSKNSEKNFFLKTMLRSYHRSYEASRLKPEYYYNFYSDIFLQIILQTKSKTIEKEGRILAFAFYDEIHLHYIYVRNSHRKQGLARKLMEHLVKDGEISVTFLNRDFITRFSKEYEKALKINYQPFSRFVK